MRMAGQDYLQYKALTRLGADEFWMLKDIRLSDQ